MHYKATDNSLHFIEPEFAHLLPTGSVPITDDEAELIRLANIPMPSAEQVRSERDARLSGSDWTDTLSAKSRLGAAAYNAWQNYRQKLRDVTDQPGFPESIDWPVSP